MVYDPQRDRPRSRVNGNGSSVIDRLLDPVEAAPQPADDATPPVTNGAMAPEPPNSWSERLLYSVGFSTVMGAAVGLTALCLLWRAWRRRCRRLS